MGLSPVFQWINIFSIFSYKSIQLTPNIFRM